ncbi:hypothetical protein SAMN05216548_102133 [Faunimonas pinastri]|uniref:Uncharacterized protein n=1 Tax=Faunimonas pinastri TaxID=1855383 RepID=A0A1H9CEW4_9HYPH|nr:hypothetical protein [Faunimonas pinastri]SEP99694.1 hypothetical protein SAMN05216548_102133 [Faunimonas pinastri]
MKIKAGLLAMIAAGALSASLPAVAFAQSSSTTTITTDQPPPPPPPPPPGPDADAPPPPPPPGDEGCSTEKTTKSDMSGTETKTKTNCPD